MKKKRLLVYGNCQAGWIASRLRETPAIAAEYEIIYLTDYAEIAADHPIHDPAFLPSVDVAVWQTAAACAPPAFRERLGPHCRQIRFPTLWLKLLWPTYMVDPRNRAEPGFPWGRFPYGDRLALKLLNEGVSAADLPSRYMDFDLNRLVNLDRYTEMVLAEMRHNDRSSDLAIAPYIEASFRAQKLFGTVNHPTFRILYKLYDSLVTALVGAAGGRLPEPAEAAEVIGAEDTPLHPQIIQHFQLRWAVPGMRYVYRSEFLDLAEYLRAYAEFRAIPLNDPSPKIYLERARQAATMRDVPDAQRILLQASVRFPEQPAFLRYLGVLLRREGEWVQAEQVARFALQCFSGNAALYSDLGVTLAGRGLSAAADEAFHAALQLDPAEPEARRRLTGRVVAIGA